MFFTATTRNAAGTAVTPTFMTNNSTSNNNNVALHWENLPSLYTYPYNSYEVTDDKDNKENKEIQSSLENNIHNHCNNKEGHNTTIDLNHYNIHYKPLPLFLPLQDRSKLPTNNNNNNNDPLIVIVSDT